MEIQEKIHPTLGVRVRSNGEVFVPGNRSSKAHWTFGCNRGRGYLSVGINGTTYSVHCLVAECFLCREEGQVHIDHINRNPSDNRVENLRWCTPSENQRNTSKYDRVEIRQGTHSCDDLQQYNRETSALWRKNNPEKYRKSVASYSNTHKHVLFADGKKHWLAKEKAIHFLALPVKQRIYQE